LEATEWQAFMHSMGADNARQLVALRSSGNEPVPH